MTFTAVVSGETAVTARGPLKEAAEREFGLLWGHRVPERLASQDPSFSPSAEIAAAQGRPLCWPARPGPGLAAVERAGELRRRARADGLTEVALLGGGAAARAAELIAGAHPLTAADADRTAVQGHRRDPEGADAPPPRRPITVLDGPEPGPLLRIRDDRDRLARTMIVVSGDDPGTDTLRRVLARMLQDADLSPAQIARRFVTVAEPGAAAAKFAAEAGHPLIEAPAPTAFGALSPYALVPAVLAGADAGTLLDTVAALTPSLARPENNPGLALGAILCGAVHTGRRTAVLGGYPAAQPGIAEWAALLLREAVGAGWITPMVQDGGLPVAPARDLFLVTFDGRPDQDDASVTGPLAAQLAVWEYAAAVAAHVLQRDVLAPREPAAPMTLDDGTGGPLFADGPPGRAVEAHTTVPALAAAPDLPRLLDALTELVGADGTLSVVAYLDPDGTRGQGTQVRRLAALLGARCGRPVTVGWGALGSGLGNDHAGEGVYLLLTGNVVRDVRVPDRHHRLGMLQLARALADAREARAAGRPVVRLHLQNRWAGLARLLDSAGGDSGMGGE